MDDDTHGTLVENLERMFPGIDYSNACDKSDFLTWLSSREERIIAGEKCAFQSFSNHLILSDRFSFSSCIISGQYTIMGAIILWKLCR